MRALAMVCAVLLAAACLPAAALAQEKDPSALWDSFPLDPTPTPGSGERDTATPRAAGEADDGPSPFVLFGLMVLAAGVGGSAVVLTRTVRRNRETPASEPAPEPVAAASTDSKPGPERVNGTPVVKRPSPSPSERRRRGRAASPAGRSPSGRPSRPSRPPRSTLPAPADRAAPKPEAPKPAIPRQAPARAASLKLAPAPLPRARSAEPAPATPAEPAKPAEPAVAPTLPLPRLNKNRAAKPAPQPAAKNALPAAKRLDPLAPEPAVAPAPEPQPVERAEPAPPLPVEPHPAAEPQPQPVEPAAPAPVAPLPPAAPARPVAVPAYSPAAAPGADVCRIRLRQGSSQSRFFAERLEGGPPLARSVPFRLRGGKSPEDRDTVKAALGGLLAELEAEGWHAVGRGRAPWEVELRRYA